MDVDALIAAGVYDPDAPDAGDRLALLRWLLEQGVPLEQIVEADERGTLYRAGLEALLWPEGNALTVREVAKAAGLPEETVRRARRLLGLTDPGDAPTCHRAEIDLMRALAGAMEMFGEELALQFARVVGTSTAAIAEAAISTFTVSVAGPMREAGASQVEYAQRVREATRAFTAAQTAIDVATRLQFDGAVERLAGQWNTTEWVLPDELEFTVAFVDLADSTRLAITSEPTTFAAAVRDFEGSAAEAAARHGARLVKLIGDSAMLAAPDPEHIADTVLDLVDTIANDERFRGAHGGMASGRVAARNGDYFGPPVNLASRLTEESPRGQIFCDSATAAAMPTRAIPIGERSLRGFDEPQPVYLLLPDAQPPGVDT